MSTLKTFLQQFNDAFVSNDTDYILDHITEDFQWNMVGEQPLQGKEAMRKALQEMKSDNSMSLDVHGIITQASEGVLHGSMRMKAPSSGELKTYGFCDVYRMSDSADHKVSALTSFVIDTKGK